MAKTEFTVLIVGGSVTGLTLANMFEQLGIKFVLLEAYPEIAPQVGASIALQATGLRILDQLGCTESLLSIVDTPLRDSSIRGADGISIKDVNNLCGQLQERHGYPMIFIDRQMLLQTLYNNLKSKDSILTGKRVSSVQHYADHVDITTVGGETFRGDILIGADGIHSTVRKEMWRLAKKQSPAYFPANEWSTVPCDYKCVFGISKPDERLVLPGSHFVLNEGWSYLVATGPGGRVYWFLFEKLPTTLYGDDIPKYNTEDEQEMAAHHATDLITTKITFGNLYDARTSSALTPLHEHVFKKWFYKRIMTVGDSAHKFEPITGNGGNSAIESAAILVNHLFAAINRKGNSLNNTDIEAIFSKTQSDQFDRVAWLVSNAHERQRLDAMETPLLAVMAKLVARVIPPIALLQLGSEWVIGNPRLQMLPVPHRPHVLPFNDELPAEPFSLPWLPAALGFASQAIIYWISNRTLLPIAPLETFHGKPLRTHYLGIKSVDNLISMLVSAFGVIIDPKNAASRMQIIYFMPVIFSSLLDWTIEGYRAGNQGSLISWPSVYGAVYQLLGIGRVAPLYNLATITTSVIFKTLGNTIGRPVPEEASRALLPGLLIGFALPSLAMFYPFRNTDTWQKAVALWQPSPVYVGILVSCLSKLYYVRKCSKATQKAQPKGEKVESKRNARSDKALRQLYTICFGVSALFHLYSIYYIWKTPGLSIANVFGNLSNPFGSLTGQDADHANVFKWDLALNVASATAQGLYRIWDLRRRGYIKTVTACKASLYASLGQVFVGPAAAQIGLCAWRENVLVKLSRY